MANRSRGTRAQASAPAPEPTPLKQGEKRDWFFEVQKGHPHTGRTMNIRLVDEAAVAANDGDRFLRIENWSYRTDKREIADYLTREIKAGRLLGITPKIVVAQICPLCKNFQYDTSAKGMASFQAHLLAEHALSDADEPKAAPAEEPEEDGA